MLGRILYFIFIGWWLGIFVALAGYLLSVTIILLPIGVILLNRLPTFIYLREPGEPCEYGFSHRHIREELPFLLRALWFILIGWELGFIAIVLGYLMVVSIVLLPFGIWLLNRVPLILTLSQHYE